MRVVVGGRTDVEGEINTLYLYHTVELYLLFVITTGHLGVIVSSKAMMENFIISTNATSIQVGWGKQKKVWRKVGFLQTFFLKKSENTPHFSN